MTIITISLQLTMCDVAFQMLLEIKQKVCSKVESENDG